jgi:hypothetical protein
MINNILMGMSLIGLPLMFGVVYHTIGVLRGRLRPSINIFKNPFNSLFRPEELSPVGAWHQRRFLLYIRSVLALMAVMMVVALFADKGVQKGTTDRPSTQLSK